MLDLNDSRALQQKQCFQCQTEVFQTVENV